MSSNRSLTARNVSPFIAPTNIYSSHHELIAIVTTTCENNLSQSLNHIIELAETGYQLDMPNRQGRTGLSYAAGSSKYVVAELLLEVGADPNIQDDNGMSALHIACCTGSLDTIKLLVNSGAFIYLRDNRGDIPLHHAIRCGRSIEIIEYLVSCDIDALHASNYSGETPLQYAESLDEKQIYAAMLDVQQMYQNNNNNC